MHIYIYKYTYMDIRYLCICQPQQEIPKFHALISTVFQCMLWFPKLNLTIHFRKMNMVYSFLGRSKSKNTLHLYTYVSLKAVLKNAYISIHSQNTRMCRQFSCSAVIHRLQAEAAIEVEKHSKILIHIHKSFVD